MIQTNRTLLLKEINPDIGNILTYIYEIEEKKSLSDEDIVNIHKRLEVTSYSEFMKKFTPSIYMLLNTNDFDVKFSLEHFGVGEEVIRMDSEESLFSALVRLIEAKHQKKYILSGFSDMLRNLIPKEDTIPVLNERDKIIKLIIENNYEINSKIKIMIGKFCEKYDDGLLLITCFLQDSVWYVDHKKEEYKNDKAILENNDKMQISVMKVADRYSRNTFMMEEEDGIAYEKSFLDKFHQITNDRAIKNNMLIQYLFLLPSFVARKNNEDLFNIYDAYSKFYIDLLKKFWSIAKPYMETLLGVKEFFAQSQDVDGCRPSLVVANFSISDLNVDADRKRFELYLETVNDKNYLSNVVWYAILPNVASDRINKDKITRERFQARRTESFLYQKNEIPETAMVLDILARHKIITFMSFEVSKEDTFNSIAINGLSWINDQLLPFEKMQDKDFIVPCYPNFVVVSEQESCMNMGVSLDYDEIEERLIISEERNIWFDEIGIEASYVAAGLFAACQSPEYLGSKYKRGVMEDTPGVAYRITEKEHYLQTYTNMLSDSIEYDSEIMNEVIKGSKGILFGQVGGKVVVLTDRTYAYGYGNQLLISMVQTVIYVERIIQNETQDFKKNLIKQFFQARPGSIFESWKKDSSLYINSILKDDEDLAYDIDEDNGRCTFSMNFVNHGYIRRDEVSMFKE